MGSDLQKFCKLKTVNSEIMYLFGYCGIPANEMIGIPKRFDTAIPIQS